MKLKRFSSSWGKHHLPRYSRNRCKQRGQVFRKRSVCGKIKLLSIKHIKLSSESRAQNHSALGLPASSLLGGMHLCCPMEQSHCVSPRMPVHCLRNNHVPSLTHKCTHAHQHCSPRRCMGAVWQPGLWLSSCQFELLLFPPETIHPLCSLVYLLSYCTNPGWHYFRLEPYLSTQWNCFDFVLKKNNFMYT